MAKERRDFHDDELDELKDYLLARGQSFETPTGKVFIYNAGWNDKRVALHFPEWHERTIGYKRQELVGDLRTMEEVMLSLEERLRRVESLIVWLAQQGHNVPADLLPKPPMMAKYDPKTKQEKLLRDIDGQCKTGDLEVSRAWLLKAGKRAGFTSDKATRASVRHLVRAGRLVQIGTKRDPGFTMPEDAALGRV